MKGIILAGGSGTRLHPTTQAVCKQLLPVYNKPMIYYPLSTLMLAGIIDILIISTSEDLPRFKHLLGNGSKYGLLLSYAIQPNPEGIAQALIIGEEFIGDDDVCLILGDNIFYGHGLTKILQDSVEIVKSTQDTVIFGYRVTDPKRYGVVTFDKNKKAISIVEKPTYSESHYAVVGLYFYPSSVTDIAKALNPSDRGELEITSINQTYLSHDRLRVQILGRGYAWLDTGTHESLLDASNFIRTIEHRQGLKVADLDEIAYKMGYVK